jgi:hypothetical protein
VPIGERHIAVELSVRPATVRSWLRAHLGSVWPPYPKRRCSSGRGDALDPAVLRADAARFVRRYPAWGRYGVSDEVAVLEHDHRGETHWAYLTMSAPLPPVMTLTDCAPPPGALLPASAAPLPPLPLMPAGAD